MLGLKSQEISHVPVIPSPLKSQPLAPYLLPPDSSPHTSQSIYSEAEEATRPTKTNLAPKWFQAFLITSRAAGSLPQGAGTGVLTFSGVPLGLRLGYTQPTPPPTLAPGYSPRTRTAMPELLWEDAHRYLGHRG